MEGLDFIKIVMPAVVVFITAYLMIDKLLKNEERRRNFELQRNNLSTITPVRLRAYERLMLVLERTTPSNMMLSLVKPNMTNGLLHSQLLSNIRQEFSHNLSQQIYVSNEVWNTIKVAQESLLRLVNTCAADCNPNGPAAELAELVIKVYHTSNNTPTEQATEMLKEEVRKYLGNV
jgi:hypothetical protein